MPVTRKEVAQHLLRLQAASQSFQGFMDLHFPEREYPPFQRELIETLDRFEKNHIEEQNLLITMPPRFGKSETGSIMFPSYFMARDPSRYVMSSSYNNQLAIDFGRQIRQIVEDSLTSQAFPDFKLSTDSRAADVWRTEVNGAYFGVGLGGTTTGRPANLLIVDDPFKSREDADSMLLRNRVWNYYTSALSTRLQPQRDGTPGKRIVILTRWHPDDLAGRLMKTEDWREGRWKHINFKAITEVDTKLRVPLNALPKDDPRYVAKLKDVPISKRYVMGTREVSLWPERFPLEDLKRRERLNPREFASLYQQSPYVLGGNLIKTQWWQRYPIDVNPNNFPIIIIAVDTAFKKTETSDYSVAVVAGIDNIGDIYILDVQRGKWEYPDLKRRLVALNNRWRGHGLRAFYVEDKASGQSIIQDLKRESGLAIVPYKVVFDKVARVNSILPLIEGGRVHLPDEAPWLDAFVEECVTFPGSTHDDQVDALAMALDVLARTGIAHQWESLDQVTGSPLTTDTYKGKSLSELASINHSFKGYGAI
jgi:predicted phage terminase large subunit-like protein